MMKAMGGGNGAESDIGAMMSMLGKGKGKGQGDPNAEHEEEGWKWNQKGDEVQVTVPLSEGTTKKDISVVFKATSLKVSVKGATVVEGQLSGAVETDECTWCLSGDRTELHVMLTKVTEGNW